MKHILFLLLLLSITPILMAQTKPIPASIDVKKLNDAQVKEAKQKLESSGLSQEAAIQLARSKGATEAQIQEMIQRMNQVNSETSTDNQVPPTEADKEAKDKKDQTDEISRRTATMSAGGTLFGSYLFNSKNLTFEPNLNIQTPKDYTVGIGDQVIVNIWGSSQSNYQITVNQNGQIMIPDVGPVYIAGLKFKEASAKIIERLSAIYADLTAPHPNTFAQINMGQLRSIRINVVGEVVTPGTYTLPATATLFNALYLTGGPNVNGSFRNIQIIRDGKPFKSIDIYKFLVDANPEENISLQNEDIVFVPVCEKRVQTTGQFKRNALFEMKTDESLKELFRFAGGFTDETYTYRFQIKRKTPDSYTLLDILSSEIASTKLQNGDIVTSGKILNTFNNRVILTGAVLRPGEFEWNAGLTLLQLISNADGLMPDAYTGRAIITRLNPDLTTSAVTVNLQEMIKNQTNVLLQKEDVVLIKSQFELKEDRFVAVGGDVRMPGRFPFSDNLTLGDALFLAGGLKESADSSFVELSRRLTYQEASVLPDTLRHVFSFKVNRDLTLQTSDQHFPLIPYDIISVRNAPGYRTPGVVILAGEVVYAGPFSLLTNSEKISDLIRKGGGFTPEAEINGAILYRTTKELGTEKISMNMTELLKNPGGPDDLHLRSGDLINIPKRMQTVKISGNVLNPLSTTYVKGLSLKRYLDKSGGLKDRTDKRRIYVLYPNGNANIIHKFLFIKKYPTIIAGSEIIVPVKPDPVQNDNLLKSISIASTISTFAITVITLINLTK